MDKRDLAAHAVETLAHAYPTPTADTSASATAFYHETGDADHVSLHHIDPQLDPTMSGGDADTAMQDRGAMAGHDESYPESHLNALKGEASDDNVTGYGGAPGDVNAYTGTSLAMDAAGPGGDSDRSHNGAGVQGASDQEDGQSQEQQQQQHHHQHQQHQQAQDQVQGGRPAVSVQELQLAAQLSQGLAPMMREAHARRVEASFQDVGSADAGGSLPTQDEAAALRVAAAAVAAADSAAYGAQDVSYHGLPQDADVQGPGGYGDATGQGVGGNLPTPLQLAQMAQHAYPSNVDHIPPRKRSKVSRACDACRRKKIKCDSLSETEQCTNCRRANAQCLFSRIPQKRGPSKGYIKELADRINSIEGKLGREVTSAADLDLLGAVSRRESAEAYGGFALNDNAKRPYASMSGDTPQTSPAPNRHAGWVGTPKTTALPYQTPGGSAAAAAVATRTPYSGASLAPQPQIDPETPAVLSRQLTDMERLLPLAGPADHQTQELDDAAYDTYLTAIHPTLPFLASSRSRVLDLLAPCPQLLQDAFTVAIRAAADSIEGLPTPAVARIASALLAQWEAEGAPHTLTHDLVHLQTLLLLAVEADSHGPQSLKGQHGGLSKTTLLSRAVAVAYGMDLPAKQLDDADGVDIDNDDNDTEAQLGLRAWWSLVVLDRWNAVALAKPLLIPERAVVLSARLRTVLGESAFRFTQLSYLLGSSIAAYLLSSRPVAPPPAGISLPFGEHVDLGLEMWRSNLPDAVTEQTHPLVHLAYWHYRLVAYLVLPSCVAADVLWAAKKLVRLVVATYAPRAGQPRPLCSPFYAYWACLPGMVLTELATVDKVRPAALESLNDLLEVVVPGTAAGGSGMGKSGAGNNNSGGSGSGSGSGGGGASGSDGGGDDRTSADTANCSLWNGPLRDTLARKLQPTMAAAAAAKAAAAAAAASVAVASVPAATEAGDATAAATSGNADGTATAGGQSLQHLADLATATVAQPATAGVGGGSTANNTGLQASSSSGGGDSLGEDALLLQGARQFQDLGFDPLPMLRGGYLCAVREAADTGRG